MPLLIDLEAFLPDINGDNGSGYKYKLTFSSDTDMSNLERTSMWCCYEECLSQIVNKKGAQ